MFYLTLLGGETKLSSNFILVIQFCGDCFLHTDHLKVNLLVERAVLGTGHLTLELAAVLVLHVLDDHHELGPGTADHRPVAGVEGCGDVVDGQELGDWTGEVVT